MNQRIDKQTNAWQDYCFTIEDATEAFVTARLEKGETRRELFKRVAGQLESQSFETLKLDVFANVESAKEDAEYATELFGCPPTWVQGDDCEGKNLAGIQLHAIRGADVRAVELDGERLGKMYESSQASHCFLGGITSSRGSDDRGQQAQEVLEKLNAALTSVGMEMTDMIRTWFFNCNILEWYDKFNAVRTTYYKQKGILDGFLPPSTGIGAANPFKTALIAGAISVKPGQGFEKKELPSPLQGQATSYGSSFSRAGEFRWSGSRRISVSGTASIDPDGNTMHLDQVGPQIARTVEVVKAILEANHMSLEDAVRATAYFRRAQDAGALKTYCQSADGNFLPWVVNHSVVCRDDLLFEIELDAVKMG